MSENYKFIKEELSYLVEFSHGSHMWADGKTLLEWKNLKVESGESYLTAVFIDNKWIKIDNCLPNKKVNFIEDSLPSDQDFWSKELYDVFFDEDWSNVDESVKRVFCKRIAKEICTNTRTKIIYNGSLE
jgi:hypothetical protein